MAATPLVVLDVREKDAFDAAHVPGAKHLPRGQLELRIDEVLPDPTARIVTFCEFGRSRRSPPRRCEISASCARSHSTAA